MKGWPDDAKRTMTEVAKIIGDAINNAPCEKCKKKDELILHLEKEVQNIIHDTGGHFCPDWDFMFILPGSKEAEACTCKGSNSG